MKRILSVVSLVCFLFSLVVTTNAQDFDYNRAYQDYVYNYDLYKKANSEYDLARSQYLQSQTLASEEKARAATAKMLQARDQAIITYLTAVRMRMAEVKGIDTNQRDTYYSLIDDEVSFYRGHRDNISSAASLEDMKKDSDEAATRYKNTELVVYKSLSLISNGKVDNFQNETNDLISALEGKVNEIRANGDKNTDDMQRWILEIKNRVTRSQDKEVEAWSIINKIKVGDKTKMTIFNQSQSRFAESLQYLKEANTFLKQIITEIKTQD